uniref:Uncharacterized protein n=1 Tax=Rhizophora mucronata TaxID=61149 RepID=A0A2P2JMX5_RHIMU
MIENNVILLRLTQKHIMKHIQTKLGLIGELTTPNSKSP